MTDALKAAREYLAMAQSTASIAIDQVAFKRLAALVAEIDAAPKAKVRGKVGEFATIVVSHDMIGRTVRIVEVG